MRRSVAAVAFSFGALLFSGMASAATCQPGPNKLRTSQGLITVWVRPTPANPNYGYRVYVSKADCESDANYICWYPFENGGEPGCTDPEQALAGRGSSPPDSPPETPLQVDRPSDGGDGYAPATEEPAPQQKKLENKTTKPKGTCEVYNPYGAEVNIRDGAAGDTTGMTVTRGQKVKVLSAVKDEKGRWWAQVDGGFINAGYLKCDNGSGKTSAKAGEGKSRKNNNGTNSSKKKSRASESGENARVPRSCGYFTRDAVEHSDGVTRLNYHQPGAQVCYGGIMYWCVDMGSNGKEWVGHGACDAYGSHYPTAEQVENPESGPDEGPGWSGPGE